MASLSKAEFLTNTDSWYNRLAALYNKTDTDGTKIVSATINKPSSVTSATYGSINDFITQLVYLYDNTYYNYANWASKPTAVTQYSKILETLRTNITTTLTEVEKICANFSRQNKANSATSYGETVHNTATNITTSDATTSNKTTYNLTKSNDTTTNKTVTNTYSYNNKTYSYKTTKYITNTPDSQIPSDSTNSTYTTNYTESAQAVNNQTTNSTNYVSNQTTGNSTTSNITTSNDTTNSTQTSYSPDVSYSTGNQTVQTNYSVKGDGSVVTNSKFST